MGAISNEKEEEGYMDGIVASQAWTEMLTLFLAR